MRALVKAARGQGHVELQDVAEPTPGPGQVVMRVMAGGICGTDVHILHGTFEVRPPLILGHELAGVVAAVGDDVTGLEIGDRITTETDAFLCRRCAYCRAGAVNLCPQRKAVGTSSDGGFADYVALPVAGVHRLPLDMSFETGALIEPLAVAVHAVVERGGVRGGQRVVVIGPGNVGLLAAQVAAARSAEVTVAGLVRHADRFRLAMQLGIERTAVLEEVAQMEALAIGGDGLGVDLVVECSGVASARDAGLRLLRKGGRLVELAFGGPTATRVDFDTLVNRELTIAASRGKLPSSFAEAVRLASERTVDPGRLITHRFPLGEWGAAFRTAEQSGTKVVFEMAP